MKTFQEFMVECSSLQETSLTRVMSKSQKGGMAIMSAQRGDKSKAENKARSKQLEKDVRGAGLPGPTKVSGRYTENPGTDKEKKVGEKSHIITPGKKGKRAFKKVIGKLGKKYDQDSVLLQRKAGGSATLKGTSKTSWPGEGKNVKIGKMKPGRTGEFDTRVKNKTFTVDEAKIDSQHERPGFKGGETGEHGKVTDRNIRKFGFSGGQARNAPYDLRRSTLTDKRRDENSANRGVKKVRGLK